MPKCPIDGCGNPHDTWGGVATHIWKKQDDDHDMAESKDDALVWLAENGHMSRDTSETDTSSSTSPADGGDTTDPVTTDGGSTVTFPENPDADADADEPTEPATDAVEDDPTDEPECPKCGPGDVVDATAMLRRRADLGPEHKQLLRESDYVCAVCGGVFDA